ncbi:MAG TPA: diguanylate cyclase, partial [Burkholderiales bacterium]|nr:diguanylate cyclase [Burkholderiales bacterium]
MVAHHNEDRRDEPRASRVAQAASAADARLLRPVRALVMLIAVSIPLILPAVYFGLRYSSVSSAAATKVEVKAEAIGLLASTMGDMWRYQDHRLHAILELHPLRAEYDNWAVLDPEGRVLASVGPSQSAFPLVHHAMVKRQDEVIAVVRFSTSLAKVLEETLIVLLLSSAVGCVLFFVLEAIPVRMLREALRSARAEKQRADTHHQALHREKERAEVTLQCIADGVVTTDPEGRVEFLNPVAEQVTGWTSPVARGRPVTEVVPLLHDVTGELQDPIRKALDERRMIAVNSHRFLRRRDGSTIPVEETAAPIVDRAGTTIGGVLVFHDQTDARKMADQLAWQAAHDALTGLVNRSEFERQLESAFQSARTGKHFVLCYIDLDQFKLVNDTCGHPAGDELLTQICGLINARVRGTDVLGRLGGDEFGLLLKDCSLEQAHAIARPLLDAIRAHRYVWEGKRLSVGASFGLVEINATTHSVAAALSAADAACYTAKEKGRGRIEVYETSTDAAHRQLEMGWATRIRHALDEARFALLAQEYLTLNGRRDRVHLELLLRMLDENGEPVLPNVFLPPAERYGIVADIDCWVVRAAFRALPDILRPFEGSPVLVAINLTGASLNRNATIGYIESEV